MTPAWPRGVRGLAAFADGGLLQTYALSNPVPALGSVGPQPHIRALLALWQGQRELFRARLAPRPGPNPGCGLPPGGGSAVEGLSTPSDVLQPGRDPRSLREHTAGGGLAFHRHGKGDEYDKERVRKYVAQVANGIYQHLAAADAPLVLACVEYDADDVRTSETRRAGDEDLLDGAARLVLGGRDGPIAREEMPTRERIAAALRYEV